MNVPGQWIFRIGLIDLDVNIEEPDLNNDGTYIQTYIDWTLLCFLLYTLYAIVLAGLLTGPPSCARAATYCHSQATCKDYDGGVCCECDQYHYGNGRYCIKRSNNL